MRIVTAVTALLALAACTEATAPSPADAPSVLPAGFPQAELAARGAECVVYLGLSRQAGATPAGRDAPILQQSADQWRAALRIDAGMTDTEIEQLIASSVNPLSATAAAQRDAASAWCVDNAPEPDPEQ